ncbi:MAG: DUF86 domain-containing protein [Verrucomicrobia bacterium]|nr:DUF86 domain-containing protein [Kiritimatiellia bacterium]MCB1102823.1 DUF86 domain-containing protein [Kiritimatiellia bacterium]MCP5488647.1 DUF86 domain-containing protein [Verrucomicrobiota bacterium]
MSYEPHDLLMHMRDEIRFVHSVIEGMDFEAFAGNEAVKRAVVRSIEIVGEAAKKMPEIYRSAHPEIEWKRMAGMRDRLIHDYFGVDYTIVWDVASRIFPSLNEQVDELMSR